MSSTPPEQIPRPPTPPGYKIIGGELVLMDLTQAFPEAQAGAGGQLIPGAEAAQVTQNNQSIEKFEDFILKPDDQVVPVNSKEVETSSSTTDLLAASKDVPNLIGMPEAGQRHGPDNALIEHTAFHAETHLKEDGVQHKQEWKLKHHGESGKHGGSKEWFDKRKS